MTTISKLPAGHTPGPWNCDKHLNVKTPRGKLLLTGVSLTTGTHPDESEAVANTVLIAAAPDLLAALEALSELYVHTWDRMEGGLMMMESGVHRFEHAHEKAIDAIKKARGE